MAKGFTWPPRSCDLPSPRLWEVVCTPHRTQAAGLQSHLELVQVGMLWAPGLLEPHEVRGALVELRQQHLQGKGSTSGSCPFLALQLSLSCQEGLGPCHHSADLPWLWSSLLPRSHTHDPSGMTKSLKDSHTCRCVAGTYILALRKLEE